MQLILERSVKPFYSNIFSAFGRHSYPEQLSCITEIKGLAVSALGSSATTEQIHVHIRNSIELVQVSV